LKPGVDGKPYVSRPVMKRKSRCQDKQRHLPRSVGGLTAVHVANVTQNAFEGVETKLETPRGLSRFQRGHVIVTTQPIESELPILEEMHFGSNASLDQSAFADFKRTNFAQKTNHQRDEALASSGLFRDLLNWHAAGPPVHHFHVSDQRNVEWTVEKSALAQVNGLIAVVAQPNQLVICLPVTCPLRPRQLQAHERATAGACASIGHQTTILEPLHGDGDILQHGGNQFAMRPLFGFGEIVSVVDVSRYSDEAADERIILDL